MKSRRALRKLFLGKIPDAYKKYLLWPLTRAWEWILYHTTQRYHVLSLKSRECDYKYGWRDRDQLLPIAMFNLFLLYVEKELGGIDGLNRIIEEHRQQLGKEDHIDDHKPTDSWLSHYIHVRELYLWWTQVYPQLLRSVGSRWEETKNLEEALNEKMKLMIDLREGMWT